MPSPERGEGASPIASADSRRGDWEAAADLHGRADRGSRAARGASSRRRSGGAAARARGGARTLDAVAPDFIDPVVGWRAWAVVQQRKRLRLRSIVFDTVWPAETELAAGCNRVWTRVRAHLPWHGDVEHDVPVPRCSCGIYATNDPELAAEYLYLYSEVHQPRVLYRAVGLVSLWGSVVESESGWRATFAYPNRIFLPRSQRRADVEALRTGLSDYGVSVDVLDEVDSPIADAVRRVRRNRRRRRAAQSW